MGNVNTTTESYNTLKDLIIKKTPIEVITGCYDEQTLVTMLKKLKHDNFRVFQGELAFEPTLFTKDDYIELMGYNDSIQNNGEELKICVISDLHLGSVYDTPWYVEAAWNFCSKNGIKHIINLGDLTEGYGYLEDACKSKSQYKFDRTLESELNYLNMYVPNDKSIKHHILYGNHDLYSSDGISKDISKLMMETYGRKDLIVAGVEDQVFRINNDCIHLFHHSFPDIVKPYTKKLERENVGETQIILAGHSHISKTEEGENYTLECIPTLSAYDHALADYAFFTGFVVLTIHFNKNLKFSEVQIQRFRFYDKNADPISYTPLTMNKSRLRRK